MSKIAISGKANSGKNTIADMIGARLSQNYHVLAFADPIKNLICAMYPKTNLMRKLWGPSEERASVIPGHVDSDGYPLTYRRLLQDLGKMGRKYNPEIWINGALSIAQDYLEKDYLVIISDTRFVNELERLKKDNYYCIRVIRPGSSNMTDESEIDLDSVPNSEFDYILNNDGDLEDLEKKILDVCKKILLSWLDQGHKVTIAPKA